MPAQSHIGTPIKKWGYEEKSQWLAEQNKKRSYQ
ncbi:peptidase, partial [Francisella tularensis subsp. holarctica]|nr:peptidase [Francisella tularensis subsp. holarctica]